MSTRSYRSSGCYNALCIIMAYIVMAYIVMAYIAMANLSSGCCNAFHSASHAGADSTPALRSSLPSARLSTLSHAHTHPPSAPCTEFVRSTSSRRRCALGGAPKSSTTVRCVAVRWLIGGGAAANGLLELADGTAVTSMATVQRVTRSESDDSKG